MRTQECRERIDKAAEYCGLAESTVRQVKQAAEFATLHDEISPLSTDAVLSLARVMNKKIQREAITRVSEILKTGQRPTEKEIRDLIITIRQEMGQKPPVKVSSPKIVKESPDPLARVTKQMREKPPSKPPLDAKPPVTVQPPAPVFDLKKRFPFPGSPEETHFRAKLGNLVRDIRECLKDPNFESISPPLQELRKKVQEIYGDLAGPA